ncbi:MAG TPA: radical SAM family heme chaperone HemW [Actinomycetes bacterium]|nr:radical SAM family heme chaperone HemW [Actinomycetes bacterium]
MYVHVPFCLTRCHYCDFVTYTGMEGLRRPYAAALLAEAELATAALGPETGQVVTSVFVGGGTPTLLPPGDLARVLDRLRELLEVAPDAEVTVEANPETVDRAVADGLAAAGVTRVSMGAQSFDDRVLDALGRPHGAAQTGRAVAALRAAGIEAVNLDLIFGCPHEDEASWAASLAAAVGLGPEHLSAYALTIEPATKFGRLVASGRMAGPDEDLLADRYETTCATLAGAGYRHYEVSNWARDDPRRAAGPLPARASRHNLTYWRRGAYLGLGAGAHEFTGGVRRWNVPGVPEYLAAVADGRRPTAGQEQLSTAQAAFELLALRLRTADGLDPAEARELGVDPDGAEVAELRAAGLLASGPRVALTEPGMFLHGEVVTRLAS